MFNHFGDNSSKQNTHINLRPLFPLRNAGFHPGCRKAKKEEPRHAGWFPNPSVWWELRTKFIFDVSLVPVIPGKWNPKGHKLFCLRQADEKSLNDHWKLQLEGKRENPALLCSKCSHWTFGMPPPEAAVKCSAVWWHLIMPCIETGAPSFVLGARGGR